jgi:cytochrome c oxidase assembly protein subunit 11
VLLEARDRVVAPLLTRLSRPTWAHSSSPWLVQRTAACLCTVCFARRQVRLSRATAPVVALTALTRLLCYPAHSLPSHAGYGGTTQRAHSVEDAVERLENPDTAAKCRARNITITFNADVADGLPWRFVPTQRSVSVHPGESALAFYRATNTSSVPIVGVSTYNVAPARAGLYFRKVQCFCFEEQRLEPGEAVDMPLLFYLDPEFVDDPKCNAMNHVTLSYTFWKAGASADAALEEAAARDFEVDAEAQEQKAAAGSAR